MRAVAACKASNRHSRRIAAGLGLDHLRAGTRAPDFQLINRRRAKSIGSAQQHALAIRTEYLRQFADRRRLAGTVHANHQNHFRRALYSLDWPAIGCIENCQQFFLQQAFQFLHVFNLLAVGLVTELAQNFLRGRSTQVGAD